MGVSSRRSVRHRPATFRCLMLTCCRRAAHRQCDSEHQLLLALLGRRGPPAAGIGAAAGGVTAHVIMPLARLLSGNRRAALAAASA